MSNIQNGVKVRNIRQVAGSRQPITLREYIAKKSKKELSGMLGAMRRSIVSQLTDAKVAKAEVDAELRQAFGIPQGTQTKEQAAAMDSVLRLASWVEFEVPTKDRPVIGWTSYADACLLLDRPVPKLSAVARKAAGEIVKEHVSKETVKEHGGFEDLAVQAVLDKLFAGKVAKRDAKTAREEYFVQLAQEFLQLMGR